MQGRHFAVPKRRRFIRVWSFNSPERRVHDARSKQAEEQFEDDGQRDEHEDGEQEDVRPAEHVAAAGAALESEAVQWSFTVRALRHCL